MILPMTPSPIIDRRRRTTANGANRRLLMHAMSFKLSSRVTHRNSPMSNAGEKVRDSSDIFTCIFSSIALVPKPLTYPNHVLHPEVIPSLNDVPAELIKRRNIRFTDPSTIDSLETDIPLEIASSLQDELERAVQNRFDLSLSFRLPFWTFLLSNVERHWIETPIRSQQPPPATEKRIYFKISARTKRLPKLAALNPSNTARNSSSSSPRVAAPRLTKLVYAKPFNALRLPVTFSTCRTSKISKMPSGHSFARWSFVKSLFDPCPIALTSILLLSLRSRYMIFSLQSFPTTVARFLTKTLEQEDQSRRVSSTIRASTGRDQPPAPLSPSSSSSSSPSLIPSVTRH